MTPTLDTGPAMCGSLGRGRTTSSRAGADLGWSSDSFVIVALIIRSSDSVHRASPLYLWQLRYVGFTRLVGFNFGHIQKVIFVV